ncbi:hypothetical protein [Hyphomonas sp.]|jgi:hypothetical protein|uniref:hypothetical protein n=1 Tax=Hyphomonas sp. TaxID=87 RepID=UPI003569E001
MIQQPLRATTAALLAGIVLAAACSGSASPDSKESASDHSDATSAKTENTAETDRLLGRVNLPAPDWLPKHFPLPDDRRIYSKTEVGSVPPAHQLQARTMTSQEDFRDAIVQWGVDTDTKVEEVGDLSGMLILTISGGGFGGASSVQIIDDPRGNRRIVLTLQDEQ